VPSGSRRTAWNAHLDIHRWIVELNVGTAANRRLTSRVSSGMDAEGADDVVEPRRQAVLDVAQRLIPLSVA
jgi:hypothetical protein